MVLNGIIETYYQFCFFDPYFKSKERCLAKVFFKTFIYQIKHKKNLDLYHSQLIHIFFSFLIRHVWASSNWYVKKIAYQKLFQFWNLPLLFTSSKGITTATYIFHNLGTIKLKEA
jgi:hypothetical protein